MCSVGYGVIKQSFGKKIWIDLDSFFLCGGGCGSVVVVVFVLYLDVMLAVIMLMT